MQTKNQTFSLENAIDIHCEFADLISIQNAINVPLKYIILKWPGGPDLTLTASLINKLTNTKTKFFGGIVLDNSVGGLNIHAVQNCAKTGGVFVWLPVKDAKHHRLRNDLELSNSLEIIDNNGDVLPEVKDILEVISENKLNLGTGHISGREILALVKEAENYSIPYIVLNHPLLIGTGDEMLTEIMRPGILIEHCYVPNHPQYFDVNLIINSIKRFGIENSLIGDFGNYDGLPNICDLLLEFGLDIDTVRKLSTDQPFKLLKRFLD